MILLVCAVNGELAFWGGSEGIELLVTGVGPVEAACAVGQALAAKRYKLVVSAGIAGAFEGAAAIGDGVAVCEEHMEVDLETGHPILLPDGRHTVERVAADAALCAGLRDAGYATLSGITVSRVTSSESTAQRLAALGAQVESMEGFAVLRAAERAGVPAIEIRGISNRVGDRDQSGWTFDAGVHGLRGILSALFKILQTRV